MFILVNTASLQIIPTTVIAIRSSLNSPNPTKIIFAVWVKNCIDTILYRIPLFFARGNPFPGRILRKSLHFVWFGWGLIADSRVQNAKKSVINGKIYQKFVNLQTLFTV